MSSRFCAECGNTESPLYDNFCERCYWKFNKIASVKSRRLDIPYCLTCYAVKLLTGWSKDNEQRQMPEVVAYGYMRNIGVDLDVDVAVEVISDLNWLDPNPEFVITYKATSHEIEIFEPHHELLDSEVKLHGGICKSCVRRKTGSHDVTVQLRALDRSLTKDEVDTASTLVFTLASNLYHETKDAYISDIIENHGGLDFYLGSNNLADIFINGLKKKWIGYHEKNFKLVTEEKDNKRVYRATHLYRIPSVFGGELVNYKNELFKVLRIGSSSVNLVNIRDRVHLNVKDWEKITKPLPDPYIIRKIVISEDKASNSYLLMDLISFENEEVDMANFPKQLPVGEEIDLLYWNVSYYLPY